MYIYIYICTLFRMGWDYGFVWLRRMVSLSIPQIKAERTSDIGGVIRTRKIEMLGEESEPHCHLFHHISSQRFKPGPLRLELATNRLQGRWFLSTRKDFSVTVHSEILNLLDTRHDSSWVWIGSSQGLLDTHDNMCVLTWQRSEHMNTSMYNFDYN